MRLHRTISTSFKLPPNLVFVITKYLSYYNTSRNTDAVVISVPHHAEKKVLNIKKLKNIPHKKNVTA